MNVTGGRVRVRAEGEAAALTLIVHREEHPDGTVCTKCTLTDTGEAFEPVDDDTWRSLETGRLVHRIDPLR